MTIKVDPNQLADALNAKVDVPYIPESLEAQAFRAGIAAAIEALVNVVNGSEVFADYGVTVAA